MNYTVKQNDTLSQIADANNTTVKTILDINPGLTEKLRLGQTIKLPVLLFKKPKSEPVKPTKPQTQPAKPAQTRQVEKETVEKPIEDKQNVVRTRPTEERKPVPNTMPTFEDFAKDLELIEEQYDLPSGLLSALAYLESRGNPGIEGSADAGAKGMFQATPIFLEHAKISNPYDLERIPRAAAAYLKHAKNTLAKSKFINNFEGFGWDKDWELAMMAYHAGTQGVLNWLKANAPLDGNHKNVGDKTLLYAERTADLMLSGASPQLIEPGWRKYTNT